MIKSEKISFPIVELFSAILFLFFIQQITFLVESIYMLNLLNTKMDARVGGISFLLLPGLLFVLKHNKATYMTLVAAMLVCMFLSPLISPSWRIFSSGIGAGLFLTYLGLQLSDKSFPKVNWGQSAALATLTSILFRVTGDTLDISITGNTKFIGWALIILAAYLAYSILRHYKEEQTPLDEAHGKEGKTMSLLGSWTSIRGIGGALIFIYFVFSSPGIIARWIEGNYNVIHIVLSLSIFILVFVAGNKIMSIKGQNILMLIWNVLFLICFIWNILLHKIGFPTLELIAPVVVGKGIELQSIVNYLMLILSPIIFFNIDWFIRFIKPVKPSNVAWPFFRSAILIIVCIFMLIFTNTWGYVGAVSRFFRNQFVLPFILAGIFLILPYFFIKKRDYGSWTIFYNGKVLKIFSFILVIGICGFVLIPKEEKTIPEKDNIKELTLMTYNIQQGVDLYGNKNFEGQLKKIKEINPDVVCLQESDASRISGGNSDIVRYFSRKLGYYSYYGPKTVAGTYGTAILSRFPMENTRTIFTYSSKDEIGIAIADISVGGRKVTIINSHPAGNDKSKQEHIDMVTSVARQNQHVIAMGDYNFKQDSPYYQTIIKTLNDSWLSLYPNAIGSMDLGKLDLSIIDRKRSSGKLLSDDRIDMSLRIDHIFLSNDFKVKVAQYLPAPESATDHPLYWAVVSW